MPDASSSAPSPRRQSTGPSAPSPTGPSALSRGGGAIRLTHPFPSLLNSLATVAIATLAGADAPLALQLGLSMLCVQASIGALNDVVDAPLDRRQKPAKPVASGLVPASWALAAAVGLGAIGLLVSAVVGIAPAIVIGAGLALGWLYDLRLSRTAWSWLPLALALPVVPAHAWLGATGSVPGGLLALVPATVVAGGTLALANGLVDVERDALAGRRAAVVQLGARRAWVVQTVLFGALALLATLVAPTVPGTTGGFEALRTLRNGGIAVGCVLLVLGAGALAASRAGIRERGWELEALGVAAIGVGWLAGTAAAEQGGGG